MRQLIQWVLLVNFQWTWCVKFLWCRDKEAFGLSVLFSALTVNVVQKEASPLLF